MPPELATPETAPAPACSADGLINDASATPPMPRAAEPRNERRVCLMRYRSCGSMFRRLFPPLPEGEGRGEGLLLVFRSRIRQTSKQALTLTLSLRERG